MAEARFDRRWQNRWREFAGRRLPHGLLGPRYLWPGGDGRIRLHRRLWWQSRGHRPRPLWLLAEFWLWLRWTLWHALPACRRAARRRGAVIEAEEGIPRRTQARRILKLALWWSIPPRESYRFGLYRTPDCALDFVYESEVQAYHRWRSAPCNPDPHSLARLQDKAGLARELAGIGIEVVPTLAEVPRGQTPPLEPLVREAGRVFCKMNGGNQGRGAFAAWTTAEGIAGQTFRGEALADGRAVEAAWQALSAQGRALVQPCLANHPLLAPLAFNDETITVRFISRWTDGDGQERDLPTCLNATLEVPAGRDRNGRTFYAILPIAVESGRPGEPMVALWAEPGVRDAVRRVGEAARAVAALPGWARLVEAAFRAHRRFPDIHAIAWDWAVTPDGPRLLEGNGGWGAAVPQLLLGGFLAGSGGVSNPGLCEERPKPR